MLNDCINLNNLINELEVVKDYCEWEYSIIYTLAVEKTIELLKQVQADEKARHPV